MKVEAIFASAIQHVHQRKFNHCLFSSKFSPPCYRGSFRSQTFMQFMKIQVFVILSFYSILPCLYMRRCWIWNVLMWADSTKPMQTILVRIPIARSLVGTIYVQVSNVIVKCVQCVVDAIYIFFLFAITILLLSATSTIFFLFSGSTFAVIFFSRCYCSCSRCCSCCFCAISPCKF